MDIKLLEQITRYEVLPLMEFLGGELSKYYKTVEISRDAKHGFLFAPGTIPVAVVAHLDTVHRVPVQKVKVSKALHMSSSEGIGGDDRCGVFIILSLLMKGLRPTVIFTTGEEIGGLGARAFTSVYATLDNVNWMIEFDRAGYDEVVNYSDQNPDLIDEIVKFGFQKARGSFTDISILAPHFKRSAVNVSSAYYNPHQTKEYIDLYQLDTIIKKAERILTSSLVKKEFIYKEAKSYYSSYKESERRDNYFKEGWLPGKTLFDSPQRSAKRDYVDNLVGQCAMCGKNGKVVDTYEGYMCASCAKESIKHGGIQCDVCGTIHEVSAYDRDKGYVECLVCGNKLFLN